MNIYEALVMTVFAASAVILAISNHNAQLRAEANSKKIARLSAENEKLKAENNRLKFGKQIETFFMSIADDGIRREKIINGGKHLWYSKSK